MFIHAQISCIFKGEKSTSLMKEEKKMYEEKRRRRRRRRKMGPAFHITKILKNLD